MESTRATLTELNAMVARGVVPSWAARTSRIAGASSVDIKAR